MVSKVNPLKLTPMARPAGLQSCSSSQRNAERDRRERGAEGGGGGSGGARASLDFDSPTHRIHGAGIYIYMLTLGVYGW